MTTSRVAELMTVRVMRARRSVLERAGLAWRLVVGGARAGPPSTPPDWMSWASRCLSYSVSSRSTSAATSASMSSPQACCDLAPLLDVVVVGALAGAAGRLVDGDLEARVEDDLALAPAVAGGHLGRDVPPPDHGHRRHGGQLPPWMACLDGRGEVAEAGRAALEGEPQAVGRGARLGGQVRVVGLGEVDEPAVVAEVVGSELRMAVEAEADDHESLELAGQEVGQVERPELLVLEGGEGSGAGVELVAVGARDALDALALEHGVEGPPVPQSA